MRKGTGVPWKQLAPLGIVKVVVDVMCRLEAFRKRCIRIKEL